MAAVVLAWLMVAVAVVAWWRPRVVDVRHWDRNANAVTTVTVRRGRRLYATTRFHTFDRHSGKYMPFDVVDQRVDSVGEWRGR